ncbi:MAG: beta-ketoacyl-ACP synthase II [Bacteroidota bacterium]
MQLKRVVVTGLGALTPIGNSVPAYWEGLINGVSGASRITHFDPTLFKTQFACELKNYDPLNYFDRKEARKMDAFSQYAMVTAEEAIVDAGLDLSKIDLDDVGVIWSSGIGGMLTFQEEMINYAKGNGTPRFNPFFIPKLIGDISSGLISMKYGFRGANYVTVSACASSTNALIDAFNFIRLGKSKLIISGGSEAVVIESGIGGFNALKALSENNATPETACRPFDVDRDGFVLGEGAGALVLEELEHAQARGARIYAELVGGGLAADAYHMTATHPEGLGAFLAMKRALEDAELQPEQVDYLNVHATSTPLGDVSEMKAVERVFGDNISRMNISATKSMTGHLLGAAGAIEAIASILAIHHSIIPPTINTVNVDPEITSKANLTLGKAVQRSVDVAMCNTFGFGGHNAISVFRKFTS